MQDGSEISNQPGRQRWGTRGTAGALFAGRLTFENVSCTIGTTEILKNLSFELQAGEIACLLGQSGCGKTTLLRIAAGIQTADFGPGAAGWRGSGWAHALCAAGAAQCGPGVPGLRAVSPSHGH